MYVNAATALTILFVVHFPYERIQVINALKKPTDTVFLI